MVYLKEHLEKYPKMQLEDIFKLYLQGILGPAHLVPSYENCLERIKKEYSEIEKDNHEMIEYISDDYMRVYLYPYFKNYNSFDNLVRLFVESSKIKGDVELFKQEIRLLMNEDNKEVIEEYLSRDNYLISHSLIYKKEYDPHYLVVHRKYLNQLSSEV